MVKNLFNDAFIPKTDTVETELAIMLLLILLNLAHFTPTRLIHVSYFIFQLDLIANFNNIWESFQKFIFKSKRFKP